MLSTRPGIDWNTEFIHSHQVLCLGKENPICILLSLSSANSLSFIIFASHLQWALPQSPGVTPTHNCRPHRLLSFIFSNSGASWPAQVWLRLVQRVPPLRCPTDSVFLYYLVCFLLTYSSVQPEVKWFIFSHYMSSYGNNIQRSLSLGNKL